MKVIKRESGMLSNYGNPGRQKLLRSKIIFCLLLFHFFFATGRIFSQSFSPGVHETKRPNIIWIIADDLGYSDLRSYGNQKINTPNIDGLGKTGVRFTEAYATAPICAPSREGMITGRYQQRFGAEFMPYESFMPSYLHNIRRHFLRTWENEPGLKMIKRKIPVNEKDVVTGLPFSEITIAQLLKGEGYQTGFVGKWNEGMGEDFYPNERGYDYNYSFSGALTRYVDYPVDTGRYVDQRLPWAFSDVAAWAPRYGTSAIMEGQKEVKDTGYLTFSFADKAVDFIERHKKVPFFLTLSFNAPHDPFQAPKEYVNRATGTTDPVKKVYYAMIMAMDDAIGTVLQKLKAEGLENNTIIFFISDNGGATYTRATDNAPLRGGKCTHFEGGLTVPFLIDYPGRWQHSIVYDKPVSSLDIFATIAAISGSSLPQDRVYDGVNLLPFLDYSSNKWPHEELFWRNGYSKAYRKGYWKLYVNEKSKKIYLFDLLNDREESQDVSKKNPLILKEMQDGLKHWEQTQTIQPRWPSAADLKIKVSGKVFYFPS